MRRAASPRHRSSAVAYAGTGSRKNSYTSPSQLSGTGVPASPVDPTGLPIGVRPRHWRQAHVSRGVRECKTGRPAYAYRSERSVRTKRSSPARAASRANVSSFSVAHNTVEATAAEVHALEARARAYARPPKRGEAHVRVSAIRGSVRLREGGP